jgi:cyclophilin family peptidyl-prolyl cis-trans isomerase
MFWTAIRLALLIAATSVLSMASVVAEVASYARIQTSKGDIIVELSADKAPETVANFLEYARSGHYDRTIIHRVVPGFVVQGGGYSRIYTERPTRRPVKYEGDNGLRNERGAIAMARRTDPDSAAAQWFINLQDNPKLDHRVTDLGPIHGYAVFGRVIGGMDVVDEIGAAATGPGGPFDSEVPIEMIFITRVDLLQQAPGQN